MKLKEAIEQYQKLQTEKKDLAKRIQDLEYEIEHLPDEMGMVTDTVTTGRRGRKAIQTITIQGFPSGLYMRRMKRLRELQTLYIDRVERIELQLLEVEKAMEECEDPLVRTIIRGRVNGDSWVKIGFTTKTSESCCKMAYSRYFKELEKASGKAATC